MLIGKMAEAPHIVDTRDVNCYNYYCSDSGKTGVFQKESERIIIAAWNHTGTD